MVEYLGLIGVVAAVWAGLQIKERFFPNQPCFGFTEGPKHHDEGGWRTEQVVRIQNDARLEAQVRFQLVANERVMFSLEPAQRVPAQQYVDIVVDTYPVRALQYDCLVYSSSLDGWRVHTLSWEEAWKLGHTSWGEKV